MQLLIRFPGDNDFHRTMKAFGKLFLDHEYGDGFLTRETISALFNEMACGLYRIAQNGGAYRDENPERTRSYLKIRPEDVYIGTDAIEHMNTWHEWGNGDSVFVDLVNQTVTIV